MVGLEFHLVAGQATELRGDRVGIKPLVRKLLEWGIA